MSEDYCKELALLRDELKLALSDRPADPNQPPRLTLTELADRIKLLRDSHSTEETPKRSSEITLSTVEESIVSRLKRRLEIWPQTIGIFDPLKKGQETVNVADGTDTESEPQAVAFQGNLKFQAQLKGNVQNRHSFQLK